MLEDMPVPTHRDAVETEHEAAERISKRVAVLRRAALKALAEAGDDGLTHDELVVVTGIEHPSIAPRCSELKKAGLAANSGRKRKNRKDNNAAVWVLTEAGRTRHLKEASA